VIRRVYFVGHAPPFLIFLFLSFQRCALTMAAVGNVCHFRLPANGPTRVNTTGVERMWSVVGTKTTYVERMWCSHAFMAAPGVSGRCQNQHCIWH
jgi:hypothetical protein